MPQLGAAPSDFGVMKRSRRPDCGCSLRPFVEGKIDDEEAGSRQFLAHLLTRFDVAGCDEHNCEFVQPGVMADDEQGMCARRGLLDDVEDFMGVSRRKAARLADPAGAGLNAAAASFQVS